jgi:hypothetical protein
MNFKIKKSDRKLFVSFAYSTVILIIVFLSSFFLFSVIPRKATISDLHEVKSVFERSSQNLSENRVLQVQYLQLDPRAYRFLDDKSLILEEIGRNIIEFESISQQTIRINPVSKEKKLLENMRENLSERIERQKNILEKQEKLLEKIVTINSVLRNIYFYEAAEDFPQDLSLENGEEFLTSVINSISGMEKINADIVQNNLFEDAQEFKASFDTIRSLFQDLESTALSGNFESANLYKNRLIREFPDLKRKAFDIEISILMSEESLKNFAEQVEISNLYKNDISDLNKIIVKHTQ